MASTAKMNGGAGSNYESKHNEEDITVDAEMEQLSKFTKIISPLFLVFGLTAVICTILSIANVDKAGGWVTFFIVVLSTVVFSIMAALV